MEEENGGRYGVGRYVHPIVYVTIRKTRQEQPTPTSGDCEKGSRRRQDRRGGSYLDWLWGVRSRARSGARGTTGASRSAQPACTGLPFDLSHLHQYRCARIGGGVTGVCGPEGLEEWAGCLRGDERAWESSNSVSASAGHHCGREAGRQAGRQAGDGEMAWEGWLVRWLGVHDCVGGKQAASATTDGRRARWMMGRTAGVCCWLDRPTEHGGNGYCQRMRLALARAKLGGWWPAVKTWETHSGRAAGGAAGALLCSWEAPFFFPSAGEERRERERRVPG